MSKKYELKIYNTLTKEVETVEVCKEVYNCYKRTSWNIKDNNKAFLAHEIQFTELIGGNEKAYKNFREFINTEDTPDRLTLKNIDKENLQKALKQLTPTEQELIKSLYFDAMTEAEYANQTHVKQQTVHKKKVRLLKKLKNLIHSGC